jgi:hypothetical protein
MRKKDVLLRVMVVSIIAMSVIFMIQKIASATEAQLVKIEPVRSEKKLTAIKIDPQTININKGTVVIWLSGVLEKVKVVFDDPAACQDVTADPKLTKIYTDWYDCYTTTYLPFAETTSLQFNKAGSFPYVVQTEDGKITTKGKIIVK